MGTERVAGRGAGRGGALRPPACYCIPVQPSRPDDIGASRQYSVDHEGQFEGLHIHTLHGAEDGNSLSTTSLEKLSSLPVFVFLGLSLEYRIFVKFMLGSEV